MYSAAAGCKQILLAAAASSSLMLIEVPRAPAAAGCHPHTSKKRLASQISLRPPATGTAVYPNHWHEWGAIVQPMLTASAFSSYSSSY
uniref:Secreted protein n=1 Tax=Ditylenchus dipsaci TaxID=166011 RepID=A0A915EW95_9BILA